MDVFSPAAVAPAATQAQMEAASSNAVFATPGNANWAPGAAKAFCRFNGTGTPAVAGTPLNVASITDNGVGNWTVNYTTSFSSANYSAQVSTDNDGITGGGWGQFAVTGLAAGSVNVRAVTGVPNVYDAAIICVTCHGDQ